VSILRRLESLALPDRAGETDRRRVPGAD
jgi:hypothetical protein